MALAAFFMIKYEAKLMNFTAGGEVFMASLEFFILFQSRNDTSLEN